ncbi:hypothetical protein C7G41_28715 [Bradyrhizobium sp. MOS002]|nr:hypothetical protein C7G41_28715 [Bradyrhizobium sp. MOS002]
MRGVAASFEHSHVLKKLPSAGTIIDVGANRGQFILEAIKWHRKANVIAFEPLASERSLLHYAMSGFSNLTVHGVALGDQDASAHFHVSSSADSSSLLEQTILQRKTFPGTENVGQLKVAVRRFDQIIDPATLTGPVICKIDVQGYELNVLRGFGEIVDDVDYWIIELTNRPFYRGAPNSADVIAYLAARGFGIMGIYNMFEQDGLGLQADFLFSRNHPEEVER